MSVITPWPVVAGVDGSASARAAVGWAAREARLRDLPLRLVAAVPLTSFRPVGWPPPGQEHGREVVMRRAAEHLDAARVIAERALPADRVAVEIRDGGPAEVLRDESASAQVAVVGNRGLGSVTGLLAGSVSQALAASAVCPVVVHRGVATPAGTVVVGVDGSPDGELALGYAFGQARLRGAALVAVRARGEEVVEPVDAAVPDPATAEKQEAAALDDVLDLWRPSYPDVAVHPRLVPDRAASVLVGESGGARLVVVGSRGHRALAAMVLGSVSRATVHRAHCPVAVVRGTDRRPR